MNLFDIMRQAGGGNAYAVLARQYGLSEEQIARAVEAFLPAFSAGLKRGTADPFGLADFMRRLAQGSYPQAFRDPGWAFGAGRPQGEEALAFLFGSPEAARAVADHASAFTGLAQEKLAAMLPALAAMMFGGLAQPAATANPVLDAMLKQFRAAAQEPPAAAKGPLDRYEEEQARTGGTADLARAQAEMMQAGMAAVEAGTAAWRQAVSGMMASPGGGATAAAGERPAAAGHDLFGEMFEPGRRLGEAYQREMEALVSRLSPGTTRS